MRISPESLIAKKYARAFIDLYKDELSPHDVTTIAQLKDFFSDHNNVLIYLSLSFISLDRRLDMLEKSLVPYKVSESIKKFLIFIIEKNRSMLLPATLKYIDGLYKIATQRMHYTISSSHALSLSEVASIQSFIERLTKKNITYTLVIDKELIAGIRVASETLLWEFSLQKQLRNISLSLIR